VVVGIFVGWREGEGKKRCGRKRVKRIERVRKREVRIIRWKEG
jgi:hypothetical protein